MNQSDNTSRPTDASGMSVGEAFKLAEAALQGRSVYDIVSNACSAVGPPPTFVRRVTTP